MSTAVLPVVEYDPLKGSRHPDARAARDQADWLLWLGLGGTRPRTIADYQWATDVLLEMFPGKELPDVTDGDLIHVLGRFPERSRRARAAAYSNWFGWAERTDRITQDPMRKLPTFARPKQKYIETFTDAQVALLESLPGRDGYLMSALFDAGLRRSEATHLQVRHIRFDVGELIVLNGKGGKDRIVPLGKLLFRLEEYRTIYGLGPRDFLWYDNPGGRGKVRHSQAISETSFHRWWTRCLAEFEDDIGYRNAHVTRHTFATRWLKRGGRLETLSRAMGHASIRTTSDLYGHLETSDIRRDLELVEG